MMFRDMIPQIDGVIRYVYECPRGTVAIDEGPDGRDVSRCLGGSRLTARDLREAVRLHEQILAEDDETPGL